MIIAYLTLIFLGVMSSHNLFFAMLIYGKIVLWLGPIDII